MVVPVPMVVIPAAAPHRAGKPPMVVTLDITLAVSCVVSESHSPSPSEFRHIE
jgi:hypothetical protein